MNRSFLTSTILILLVLQTFCLPRNNAFAQNSEQASASNCFKDSPKTISIPINTDRSVIFWKGTKISGKHEGTVKLQEGIITYKNGAITSGHFIADMNTIAITDIPKHEKEARKNLREHLKSDDFFYVDKYETAKFEITNVKPLEADTFLISGDLSIRDVTKEVSFEASKKVTSQSRPEFNASFTINRFDWNVAYQGSYWDRMSSILDNNLVHKEILLTIRLITNPVPEYN